MPMLRHTHLTSVIFVLLVGQACAESIPDRAAHLEFFENKIRPLLASRCYECHSTEAQSLRAGLRLDRIATILEGGDSGPAIVPGKPDESLLIQAVRWESNEMPPDDKLDDAEIAALTKWVELGAPWPSETATAIESSEDGYDWQAAREHWAWQPICKVQPPPAQGDELIANPIDQFVVARLSEAGLQQAPPASAAVFVRRVFLDLIGIPPTPTEQSEWTVRLDNGVDMPLNDVAVAELIDTLLARPQYGERWGRHWLDVARYSDVGGWSQDNRSLPQAWRYRDWVVAAFNADLPYNEFVRRQIAGDHIAQHQQLREAAVGTGFFALGPNYSSDGGDPESIAQAKGETLDDRVDTFSRAFLGLTVSCARCHDHKFDPIPTQDYYSIAGIFNNTGEGETPLVEKHVVDAFHHARSSVDDRKKRIKTLRKKASEEKRDISSDEQAQIESWEKEIKQFETKAARKYDFAHSIHDAGSEDMSVALRGDLLKPGPIAPRRFLRILASPSQGAERTHFQDGSGRKQLADAVVDEDNPLTARVIVNRVWLHHFGRALVRTPNNFGTLGETPTHSHLLDWLSATFIESGWSMKSLHRLIMSSSTYRSSTAFNEAAFAIDGDNRMMWRMNPRRMDVETWRDSLLAVAGDLDTSVGGPAVGDIVNSKRRTLYAKVSRNDPLASDEFLRLFDFPIPRGSSAQRTTNVIPPQFLFMLNSQFMLDRAAALATRLQDEAHDTLERIHRAYALLYGRAPAPLEVQTGVQFLETASTSGEGEVWKQYCQVLLSANEFMFIR